MESKLASKNLYQVLPSYHTDNKTALICLVSVNGGYLYVISHQKREITCWQVTNNLNTPYSTYSCLSLIFLNFSQYFEVGITNSQFLAVSC